MSNQAIVEKQSIFDIADEYYEYYAMPNVQPKEKTRSKKVTPITPIQLYQLANTDTKVKKEKNESPKKEKIKKERSEKDVKIEMIQLLAKKEMLNRKLNTLDPANKKDSKKIVSINVDLINIDEKMKNLESKYNVNVKTLNTGTKIGKFIKKAKEKIKSGFKKVKKFLRNNRELVVTAINVLIIAIPSLLAKK